MKKRLFISFIAVIALLFILSPAVEVAETEREISLNKSAAPLFFSEVGQEIKYEILIENTGNTDLDEVRVIDKQLGIDELIGSLVPGEDKVINATYVITTGDMKREYVENTASVTGEESNFIGKGETKVSAQDSITIEADIDYQPAINLRKEAAPTTYSAVGDIINYTITVTNTGNITLSNVVVTDPQVDLGAEADIGTLEPGAETTVSGSYTIVQADLDNGSVSNTAEVSGEDPQGTAVDDSDYAEVSAEINPGISINKEAAPTTYSAVGDIITYTITVTNTGNITLSNVVVTDSKIELGAEADIGTLEPGEETTVSGSYTIVQADLDNGSVMNTAEVTAKDPNFIGKGGNKLSAQDSAIIEADIDYQPAISLRKEAAPTTYSAVGDVITYTITVTNTGNITLSNVVVTDPQVDLGTEANIGTLEAGEEAIVSGSYTIDQADLDNGSVSNTAEVTGEDPQGTVVDDFDDAVVTAEYVPGGTETAWSYNEDYAVTFNELNISNNWGWFNGPLAPDGKYVFELWAGAGQNDFDKGTRVGYVTVSFDKKTVYYEMDGDYYLEEVQLFMGNEEPSTAAPGLLGYTKENVDSQQYTIDFNYFTDVDFNKDIYVAAHAVVGIW